MGKVDAGNDVGKQQGAGSPAGEDAPTSDKLKPDVRKKRVPTSDAAGAAAAKGSRRTSSASGRTTPPAASSNGGRAHKRREPGSGSAEADAPPTPTPEAREDTEQSAEGIGAERTTPVEASRDLGSAPQEHPHHPPDDLLGAYRGEARGPDASREPTPEDETARVPHPDPHRPDEDLHHHHFRAHSEAAPSVDDAEGEEALLEQAETKEDDEYAEAPAEYDDDEGRASAPVRTPADELRARAVTAMVLGRDFLAQAAASPTVTKLFHAANGIARAVKSSLGVSTGTELDAYGKDAQLERDLRPVFSFLLDTYWRVQVENASTVPSGPAILVANHSGALPLDGPVLHNALARARPDIPEPRWLVEDQVFYAPLLGTLLNRIGAVRASPENALRLLDEGRPVIVFPEGILGIAKPFAERYRLMRFGRGGFVKIALRTRAPIVPVAIVGAEEASPLLAKLPGGLFGLPYLPITSPVPLPSRWRIRFGEPIAVDAFPADAEQDPGAVQQLADRTRGAIQSMITELLDTRRSAFA